MLQAKPKNLSLQLSLEELKFKYARSAKLIGIDVVKNNQNKLKKSWNLFFCVLIQISAITMSIIDFSLLIHEHIHGRSTFFRDFRSSTIAIIILGNAISGVVLFLNSEKLIELFTWCLKVSVELEPLNHETVIKQNKILTYTYRAAFAVPLYNLLSTIMVSMVSNQKVFMVTLYNAELVNKNPVTYNLIFLDSIFHTFGYWRLSMFTLGTYMVFVKLISTQYRILSERVKKRTLEKSNQTAIGTHIDKIGGRHAEILENLSKFSSVFELPLMFNETLCIAVNCISATIFLYEPNEINFGVATLMVALMNLAYPALGQEISSAAKDFERAVYSSNWLHLSVVNRKKLALVLLQSQKPVGVNSGGYHFSNYTEISQILRWSYNLIIFIRKRNERQLNLM